MSGGGIGGSALCSVCTSPCLHNLVLQPEGRKKPKKEQIINNAGIISAISGRSFLGGVQRLGKLLVAEN